MFIYKYPLKITDEQDVTLPSGAIPLSVGEQEGVGLCLWALIDRDQTPVKRRVHIIGTGNPVSRSLFKRVEFIGTVQMTNGLVWHVFISKEK